MTTFDFDAIVVGSGFGGSVMTYRLAKEGLKVCLLERGKAWPPGTFPRSPWRMRTNFWDPSKRLHGMFNVWSFSNIGGVVASGLGGGSLIYANVLYRKPEDTFANEGWSITYDDLARHYADAEQMLNGQAFPFEHEPYSATAKTQAMSDAAQTLADAGVDARFELPKLAITFANPDKQPRLGVPIEGAYPSLHEDSRTRLTCQLCGECDVGCNYGSKNTLDLTYLSAAKLCDPKPCIRTNAEVRTFEPLEDGGYRVHYVDHSAAASGDLRAPESRDLQPIPLTSRFLVLSSGSFGSTYLLLKNAEKFPKLNRDALGTRFCGNGDLLTVVWKSKKEQQKDAEPRRLDCGFAPVITSAIRFRNTDKQGQLHGYTYVEDSGYPEFANWLIEAANPVAVMRRSYRFAKVWLSLRLGRSSDGDISEEIAELIGEGRLSSTSMPLLGMGRDTPDGTMELTEDDKYLSLKWDWDTSKAYFDSLRASARKIAGALHAEFKENPLTHLSRVITVHPLGGCPMDYKDEEKREVKGVVSTLGEVHGHPGFYIADGSVIPGPVGPNPSLTIAACAERFADHLIESAKGQQGRDGKMGRNTGAIPPWVPSCPQPSWDMNERPIGVAATQALRLPLIRVDSDKRVCPGKGNHGGIATANSSPSSRLPVFVVYRNGWKLFTTTALVAYSLRELPKFWFLAPARPRK